MRPPQYQNENPIPQDYTANPPSEMPLAKCLKICCIDFEVEILVSRQLRITHFPLQLCITQHLRTQIFVFIIVNKGLSKNIHNNIMMLYRSTRISSSNTIKLTAEKELSTQRRSYRSRIKVGKMLDFQSVRVLISQHYGLARLLTSVSVLTNLCVLYNLVSIRLSYNIEHIPIMSLLT